MAAMLILAAFFLRPCMARHEDLIEALSGATGYNHCEQEKIVFDGTEMSIYWRDSENFHQEPLSSNELFLPKCYAECCYICKCH